MSETNTQYQGLDYLLDLNGTKVSRDDGYTWRIDAWSVKPTKEVPHGIKYRLTLHNKYGTRVMGYDNAHAVKVQGKRLVAGTKRPYDHKHRTASDKGVPYGFESAAKLVEDFFDAVDETIKEIEG